MMKDRYVTLISIVITAIIAAFIVALVAVCLSYNNKADRRINESRLACIAQSHTWTHGDCLPLGAKS